MTESDARAQATAETRLIAHLGAFALAVIVLSALHLILQDDPPWTLWTILIWALTVLVHGATVLSGRRSERGQRRRARALRGDLSDPDVSRILDEVLQVRTLSVGTDQKLSQLQRRVESLEDGQSRAVSGDSADPFDVGALQDIPPASIPETPAPETPADPFADDRSPIDTPRYESL